MNRFVHLTVATFIGCACCIPGRAAMMTFVDPSQIATLVAQGKLKIVGAVYSLTTGEVTWLSD